MVRLKPSLDHWFGTEGGTRGAGVVWVADFAVYWFSCGGLGLLVGLLLGLVAGTFGMAGNWNWLVD